ncbi:hypothetical protein CSQ85_11920 [Bifidobacterium rousetti]|nr:hypothetical protein CSQ85_11920 [Bifidobacterium rousetti]
MAETYHDEVVRSLHDDLLELHVNRKYKVMTAHPVDVPGLGMPSLKRRQRLRPEEFQMLILLAERYDEHDGDGPVTVDFDELFEGMTRGAGAFSGRSDMKRAEKRIRTIIQALVKNKYLTEMKEVEDRWTVTVLVPVALSDETLEAARKTLEQGGLTPTTGDMDEDDNDLDDIDDDDNQDETEDMR